jgi:hypothetical protein
MTSLNVLMRSSFLPLLLFGCLLRRPTDLLLLLLCALPRRLCMPLLLLPALCVDLSSPQAGFISRSTACDVLLLVLSSVAAAAAVGSFGELGCSK